MAFSASASGRRLRSPAGCHERSGRRLRTRRTGLHFPGAETACAWGWTLSIFSRAERGSAGSRGPTLLRIPGATTGAKWRWTRPPKVVGRPPGSGEASVKPRGLANHEVRSQSGAALSPKHSYWLDLQLFILFDVILFLRVFFFAMMSTQNVTLKE